MKLTPSRVVGVGDPRGAKVDVGIGDDPVLSADRRSIVLASLKGS
jgi:hypothetical protein